MLDRNLLYKAYFTKDKLVHHHINSFNDFIDRGLQKVIDEALKHIPKDVPVEQYVAMAYGTGDIYPDAYYGRDKSEEERPKKKKKKKKKRRKGWHFDY